MKENFIENIYKLGSYIIQIYGNESVSKFKELQQGEQISHTPENKQESKEQTSPENTDKNSKQDELQNKDANRDVEWFKRVIKKESHMRKNRALFSKDLEDIKYMQELRTNVERKNPLEDAMNKEELAYYLAATQNYIKKASSKTVEEEENSNKQQNNYNNSRHI